MADEDERNMASLPETLKLLQSGTQIGVGFKTSLVCMQWTTIAATQQGSLASCWVPVPSSSLFILYNSFIYLRRGGWNWGL